MMRFFIDEKKHIPNYNFYRKEYDSKLCFILLFASFIIPYIIENLAFIFNSPKASAFTICYFAEGVTPSIIASIVAIGFFCHRKKIIIEKTEGNKDAIEKSKKIKCINSFLLLFYVLLISISMTIIFTGPNTFFEIMSSDINSGHIDLSDEV